jgi:hypothetical protein
MKIKFIKDQKDIRKNRSKVLKKGLEIQLDESLGKEYIKLGVAKEVVDKPSRPILTVKQIDNLKE